MKWPNGNRYVGNFSEGKMHGEGVLYYADGKVFRGIYKDGEAFDGIYKTKDKNGKWVENRFKKEVQPVIQQAAVNKSGKATVWLRSYPYEHKMAAIKLLREFTGFGLKEAKDIVEAAPSVVIRNVDGQWARAQLDAQCKKLGIVYEITE